MDLQIVTTVRQWRLTERVWFNAAWFQATWFCCVLGRESWVMLGVFLLALHFLLVPHARREVRRLMPLALIGVAVDGALSIAGVFDFGAGILVPAWLIILWVAFATTLNRSLAVFGRYRVIAAVIGGFAVPFNYAVGARFGAVDFPMTPFITAVVLIAIWAVLLPSLYRLAATFAQEVP